MSESTLTTIAHDEGKVILPFREDQFHNFLHSLLGQPQTLEKNYYRSYAIQRNDITHLHLLITQRVKQQNTSHFLGLNAKLYFSDATAVSFASIEALNAYNEVKPVMVVQLHLSWIFLVTFTDRNSPEKQQIDITFRGATYKDKGASDEPHIVFDESSRRFRFPNGNIYLMIRHSARTWGIDIENLVTAYVNNLERQELPSVRFLQKHEGKIIAGTIIVFNIAAITTIIFTRWRTMNYLSGRLAASLKDIPASNDLLWIRKHTELLVDIGTSKIFVSDDMRMTLHIVIFIVLSFVFGIMMSSLIPPRLGGHILYTRKSEVHFDALISKERTSLRSAIFAVVGAIVIGVVSNYIYSWLTKP